MSKVQNYNIFGRNVLSSALLCIWVALYFAPITILSGKILSIVLLVVSAYTMLRSVFNKNYHLMVLYIFMLSYSIIPLSYYFEGESINIRTLCETPETVYNTALCLLLFYICMIWIVYFPKSKPVNCPTIHNDNNYWICFLFGLFLTIVGMSGTNILEGGGYSESIEQSQRSSLYGYAIIPISLAFIYSDTKRKDLFLYCLVAFYCVKNLLFGGRIETLQLCLCVFLMRFQYKWSLKKVIFILISGYMVLTIWGLFRQISSGSFSDITFTPDGNAGEVYYSSMRVLYMIQTGVIDWSDRIFSFVLFLISMIVPYGFLPPIANLSSYNTTLYPCGGGGLAPVFFFAFLGFFGILLLANVVGKSINFMNKENISAYKYYYCVLLIATVPRWYAYYPIQIVKFCIFGVLFFLLIEKVKLK
ncbi:MAG: hypothetical protein J6R25_08960 [Bacteroidales bacterium]|nr:hypothetical protein [Bacteroidales bacterium]